MNTTLAPELSVIRSSRRLLTAADLASLPTSLPSGDVRYELDDGVLITMPPPGDEHATRQAGIIYYLYSAQLRGLGEVRGEVGIVLRRNPDRVVGADAAFILAASLPIHRSSEGYLETIPELVVEVRSPNDTRPEIAGKNQEYFDAGVQVVWLIDPSTRTVSACNADGSVQLFRDGDTLTCPLLPGFGVAVALLFSAN
jgi:Uma2 family endonuclease